MRTVHVVYAVLLLTTIAPGVRAEEPLRLADESGPSSAPPDLEDSFVRMKRTGGLSPFELVEDTVVLRGSTPMANHAKDLVNYDEHMNRMALLTLEEYRALLDKLEELDILVLRDFEVRPERKDLPTYAIEYQRNGRRNKIHIHGLGYSEDPRHAAVVDLIRETVRAKCGPIHFRNVFFEPGEVGYLNVESRPLADVLIDGVETRERTPLFGFEMKRGTHKLELRDKEKGIDRTFDVTIEPGMTTILNVDLW